MNDRQVEFITELQALRKKLKDVYGRAKEVTQAFAEEFKATQDNALDGTGLVGDYDANGLNYSDIQTMVEQGLANFINFWEGNAVVTREYGKDIRRI